MLPALNDYRNDLNRLLSAALLHVFAANARFSVSRPHALSLSLSFFIHFVSRRAERVRSQIFSGFLFGTHARY